MNWWLIFFGVMLFVFGMWWIWEKIVDILIREFTED